MKIQYAMKYDLKSKNATQKWLLNCHRTRSYTNATLGIAHFVFLLKTEIANVKFCLLQTPYPFFPYHSTAKSKKYVHNFILFILFCIRKFEFFPPQRVQNHSMAMGNLNKSKETTPTTTTALKVAP